MTRLAFAGAAHSGGTEAGIAARLRADGELAVSLVAEEDGEIIAHAAFSPVTIDGESRGWFGLGPVAVAPERQGRGVGAALVEDGLGRLRAIGAQGCVVLGDPAYYARFGFLTDPRLRYPGPPSEYFQSLLLGDGEVPCGTVAYATAFGI